jgi:protocatechuate 3,4-dioxygenase beta subunit
MCRPKACCSKYSSRPTPAWAVHDPSSPWSSISVSLASSSERCGGYRFESNKPPSYSSRPPHIHVRVIARGYRTLVTQHYPRGNRTSAVFNLVLVKR